MKITLSLRKAAENIARILALPTFPPYIRYARGKRGFGFFFCPWFFQRRMNLTMSPLTLVDLRTTLLVPLLSSSSAEDAWRVFLARYWPRIVEWAKHGGAGHDDAEQIASQVMLKLSCGRALAYFDRGQGRFRSWLRIVVQRVAIDFLRKSGKAPGSVGRGGEEDPLDALLDPASLDDLADEIHLGLSSDLRKAEAVVERVQMRIKSDTWEAYYRTAILGISAIETADTLGLSVRAVYQAKQRVGTMLREEGRAALG
jgi:RNA polymerase sigma-70 factor (ECF subfamily)